MSDFLERMIGNGEPEKGGRKRKCVSTVVAGEDHPVLDEALNIIMFYAMNRPSGSGGGVRDVGEKCSILMPDVEAMLLDPATGEKTPVVVGDYLITVERVK